ncbi:hypothetical protein H4R18_001124 [Coemansia javaensis]|uniref:TRAPPC10/Trs130 N-terminal domain-containing protein n=1 Tax=Coemansia javaensis TaxID=2761396 RepID=A0A9W8HMF9_9FUNG|nr:hypothetical protein H4R18_001124 [Coemansia javaensis]
MEKLRFSVCDEGGVWGRIEREFMSRLPLRNLIWTGGPGQTARFVERLDIGVERSGGETGAAAAGAAAMAGPILHIYLLEAQDADADTYKAVVRPRAKSWAARAGQRRGEEWLVVYLARAGEAQRLAAGPKFLGMRGTSVADRLRSDLQTRRDAERVVVLEAGSVESWNAAFLAIRERVVQALDERVAAMADEIRRMDANRMLPGWNYCKFFVFKEGLVNLYRLMGLRDGALAQYDELEAAFVQLLGAQRLSWFSKFGGGAAGDDYTDLLDVGRKAYRQQMVDNTISMFDFRMYLFGQQARLLVDMARYGELAERAQRFIGAFAQTMREPGTGLGAAFVAAWVYGACQNVVEICEGAQTAATAAAAAGQQHRALAAAKAELLGTARRELDVLGALHGRLGAEYLRDAGAGAAAAAAAAAAADQIGAESQITSPVLAAALAADERFDQIYVRTCEQATQYWLDCGRRRFAQAVQGDVARLHISRGRWAAAAAATLRALVPAAGLGAMDAQLLARLAACERRLGHGARSVECLARLAAGPQALDRAAHAAALVEAARELPERLAIAAQPLFAVAAVEPAERPGALCVVATVRSALPVPVVAERVEALLEAGGPGQRRRVELVLRARDVELRPGATAVALTTATASCPARFAVRSVTVALGRVDAVAPGPAGHVRLGRHPAAPAIDLRAAPGSDGSAALRVRVRAGAAPVDAGMRIRLFDAAGCSLVAGTAAAAAAQDGAWSVVDGALVLARALPAGGPAAEAEAEAVVALGRRLPAAAELTVHAEFAVAGAPCTAIDSDVVDLAPPLSVAASAARVAGRRVLLVRARCGPAGPVRLDALAVRLEGARDPADLPIRRALLRPGECVTAVCDALPRAGPVRAAVEARCSPVLAAVDGAVRARVAELAAAHGLAPHARLVARLVAAHIRGTLDVRTTLRDMRLGCAPLAPLSEAAAAGCAPPVRAAMRRLLADLDAALVGRALPPLDAAPPQTVRAAVALGADADPGPDPDPDPLVVSVDNARFCTVHEPTPLAVRLRLRLPGAAACAAERRVRVALAVHDAREWLVAGATARDVTLRGSAEARLDYVLVPLEIGCLRLPDVICHEANAIGDQPARRASMHDRSGALRRLHPLLTAAHPRPCALANARAAAVYAVPVPAPSATVAAEAAAK